MIGIDRLNNSPSRFDSDTIIMQVGPINLTDIAIDNNGYEILESGFINHIARRMLENSMNFLSGVKAEIEGLLKSFNFMLKIGIFQHGVGDVHGLFVSKAPFSGRHCFFSSPKSSFSTSSIKLFSNFHTGETRWLCDFIFS